MRAQLAAVPALGRCPAGATVAAFPEGGFGVNGARLATLRRVVALEGAVPLLSVAAVTIGTGFARRRHVRLHVTESPDGGPGAAYYFITAGGIIASLGIIAHTFPVLARIIGPEVARNE